jgi:hypothetical protein
MSDNEERRVKARHEVTQYYERRKVVTRRELSRADITINGEPSGDREEASSEDDDVEDETYVPSPWAQAHSQGKGITSGSGGGSGAAEIEEEGGGDEGEEEEEMFDVEEINPPSYVDIGHLGFRVPMNPTWRARVSYKGKTESMKENRRILARTQPRDAYDYIFYSLFQQDFYESVIMTKSKPVTYSQWIDWAYMENKHDPMFDRVIVACKAKHLRDILAFKKD